MVDPSVFDRVLRDYSKVASWAVWANESTSPKSGVGDLSILDPMVNPTLLHTCDTHYVLIGLNLSRPVDRPLANFHDPRPQATDFKLRYALTGTRLWGAYMTDLIKGKVDPNASSIRRVLREDPRIVHASMDELAQELTSIGASHATLVAIGRDTERLLQGQFGTTRKIIGIPHYANFGARHTYRNQVWGALQHHELD